MIKSKKQREKVIKREIKKEKKVKGFEFKLEISTKLEIRPLNSFTELFIPFNGQFLDS